MSFPRLVVDPSDEQIECRTLVKTLKMFCCISVCKSQYTLSSSTVAPKSKHILLTERYSSRMLAGSGLSGCKKRCIHFYPHQYHPNILVLVYTKGQSEYTVHF